MKNKIIILSILVAIILWIWILSRFLPEKSKTNDQWTQTNTQQTSTNSQRKKNIRKEAKLEDIVGKLNPEDCDKLEWAEIIACKNLIYQNLSAQSQDVSYCYKITDKAMSESCINNVSNNLMKTITSPEKCKTLIKDPVLQNKCIIQTQVTSWVWIKSLSDCTSITDLSLRSKCSDSYYLNKIKSSKTPNINDCKSISYDGARKECELIATSITSINTAKSQVEALKASWDTIWAIKKECETSTVWSNIQTCMRDAYIIEWRKTWNTSACNNITDSTIKDECINWIKSSWYKAIFNEAYSKKDATICAKISDSKYRAQCEKIVWGSK